MVVYIPPSKTEQMTLLSSLLANVCRKYRNVITGITGDMNACRGNPESNGAGIILEEYVDLYDLICFNDFRPTYRNS